MRPSFSSDRRVGHRARLGLLGIGAAVLGGLGYAFWPVEDRPGGSESLRPAFTVGAHADYAVELVSTVTLGVANAEAGTAPSPVQQTIAGRLAIAAVDTVVAGVLARMQLANVQYALDGERQSAVERDLSVPFAVVWSPAGTPVEFRFEPSTSASVAGILEETVRSFQCSVPVGGAIAPQWSTRESHASGVYRADYTRAEASRTCSRRRVEYLSTQDGSVALHRSRVVRSQATFTLDPQLWLESARIDEEWVSAGTGQVMARAHTRGSLRRLAGVSVGGAAHLARQFRDRPIHPATAMVDRTELSSSAEFAPTVVSVEPTAKARAEFQAALDALEASGGEDVQAMLALRDLMLEYPGLADRIPSLVRANRMADRALAVLLHAAELAGNPRAQTALVTVGEDPLVSHRHRLRAIVALGGVESPSALATEWLQQQSGGLAATEEQLDRVHTALLSLGRCGAAMRTIDPQRYQAEVQAILAERLARSPRPEHAAIALKAIGNTADASLATTVVDRLRSGSAAERSAAAEALGSMKATSARESLLGQLSTEANGRVRQFVVGALGNVAPKDPEILRDLDSRIRREPNGEARFAMARYLVDGLDARPESRQSLERLLQTETEPEIVRYVAGRLYRRAKD